MTQFALFTGCAQFSTPLLLWISPGKNALECSFKMNLTPLWGTEPWELTTLVVTFFPLSAYQHFAPPVAFLLA